MGNVSLEFQATTGKANCKKKKVARFAKTSSSDIGGPDLGLPAPSVGPNDMLAGVYQVYTGDIERQKGSGFKTG